MLFRSGALADDSLRDDLSNSGMKVTRVESYQTELRKQNLPLYSTLQDGVDAILFSSRSEERRVGKEGRSRWAP